MVGVEGVGADFGTDLGTEGFLVCPSVDASLGCSTKLFNFHGHCMISCGYQFSMRRLIQLKKSLKYTYKVSEPIVTRG